MAQGHPYQALATLKAITYRLLSTPTEQLPPTASQISASIYTFSSLLSASSEFLGSKNDTATIVHRFKSRIGVLLQDRTVEGRWAGIVLCKATIEAGGHEVLSKCAPWTRHLITILKKNDPSTTKCLAIVTLTRIFMLTWTDSNLVREITTPVLPSFVAACLSNAEKTRCALRELQCVLEALATLVPKHPTIFRAKETQVRSLCISTISGEKRASLKQKEVAQRLFTLLHYTAAKNGGSEVWDTAFQAAIDASQTTCDRLFRSVIEEWKSATGFERQMDSLIYSTPEARLDSSDGVGFRGWHGVSAGSQRLIDLMGLLRAHLTIPTSATVPMRLGVLMDFLKRVLSVTAPRSGDSVATNPQVSRDEREAIFALLPAIHVTALDLISATLDRFGHSSAPFIESLFELLCDAYRAESFDERIRIACYDTLQRFLRISGPSMRKDTVQGISPLIKGCCNDLVPSTASASVPAEFQMSKGFPTTESKLLTARPPVSVDIALSASALLPHFISNLNSAYLPRKLRTQIERTAVLTKNKEALLACVMNPARKDVGGSVQTSLLPLLAREFPSAPEVEALLRPRMPPIGPRTAVGEEVEQEEDDVDEERDDDDVLEQASEDIAVLNESGAIPSGQVAEQVNQPQPTAIDVDGDELYRTTPPPQPQSVLKRAADADADLLSSTTAKRARGLRSEAQGSSMVQSDQVTTDTVATTVARETKGNNDQMSTAVHSAESGSNAAISGPAIVASDNVSAGLADNDGDGSDFEIPPLTMEDSDEEAEGEEDDED